MSLGQTNALIKILVDKGDIELIRNNGRQLKYVITKCGYTRWLRYTKDKLSQMVQYIHEVKKVIGTILEGLSSNGVKYFVLEGDNEAMAALVAEVFHELIGENGKLLWGPAKLQEDSVVLKLDGVEPSPDKSVVHLMREIVGVG